MSSNHKIFGLAILAHPDDESFLLAGTTLKFRDEGKEIGVICTTRGEKGVDRLHRELSEEQMALLREKELMKACNILQCACKKFFKHPDGHVEELNFDQLVDEFENEINLYQPQIVLTFGEEGVTGHKDHITVGKAAMAASKLANPAPSEIWCACIPSSMAKKYTEHMDKQRVHHSHYSKTKLNGVADNKVTIIDIRKYQDVKLAAIKAHESQYDPHLVWPGFLECEYFEVIKLT